MPITPKITDAEIIQMFEDKVIELTSNGTWVKHHKHWRNGKTITRTLSFRIIKDHKRYTTVISLPAERNKQGVLSYRQRVMFRYKLLWLYTTRKPIPEGFEIDHIDHDCTNDKIQNLRLISASENNQENWSKSQMDNCLEFFDRRLAEQYGSKGDF
tara:strand:+ start:17545 stop:18012 length:468 start_codon:yes stop_codon:yes gene_type:complete